MSENTTDRSVSPHGIKQNAKRRNVHQENIAEFFSFGYNFLWFIWDISQTGILNIISFHPMNNYSR